MNPGFITKLEPPVLPVALGKSEPLESDIVENGMDDILNESDIKDIDIVLHTLCEDSIKTETVSENIHETVFVSIENAPFVKTEDIIESKILNKTEDTSDDNGQGLVEVQAKGEHVSNHSQHAWKKLNALKYHIRKMHTKVTTMYQCCYCSFKSKWRSSLRPHINYKHKDTQRFEHHCDTCDYKSYNYHNLKRHKLIHLKPEDIQYFYCYHCSHKSKEKSHLKSHIFRRHFKNVEIKQKRKRLDCDKCDYTTFIRQNLKNHKLTHLKPEEIHYFYCYHCSYKAKRKETLQTHIFRHLKNVEFKQKRKRYRCDQCDYQTYQYGQLKKHNITHLKSEEIPYFYCYHCPHKSKQKSHLKTHIFRHFKNGDVRFHCYVCDFMTLKRKLILDHIKKHFKVKIKS